MDIEYDTLVEKNVHSTKKLTDTSPGPALVLLDDTWYIKASRRARRMDLIGDYAGSEMFVIDGGF